MKTITLFTLLVLTAIGGLAQSRDIGSNQYDLGEIGRMTKIERGTVVACREIEVGPGYSTGSGRIIGGALGGYAAYSSVDGRGREVAALAATLIGNEIGNHLEREARRQKGVEVIIYFPDGRLMGVTQGRDQWFREGQVVYVIHGSRIKVLASRM